MGILVALVSGWGNVAGSPACAHRGSLHENMESLRSHLCQGCCRLFDRIQSAGRWFYRRLFAILLRWWIWLTVILLGWVAHDQNFLYIVLTFCQLPCSGRLNTPCGYGGYNIFFGIVITFICMYIYIHIYTSCTCTIMWLWLFVSICMFLIILASALSSLCGRLGLSGLEALSSPTHDETLS